MQFSVKQPLKVGIVGTGYAAARRTEAFQADERSQVLAIAGNTPEKIASFCDTHNVPSVNSWQQLVNLPEIDLIVICNINRDHGLIARAALEAGKHVVIEYPLDLEFKEAEAIVKLAQQQEKLLHVEHIELLGGLHQAIRESLPKIGQIFLARYTTIMAQRQVPRRWVYHQELFGFPLSAALSRVHRFTDLFGEVKSVNCQSRFWETPEVGYCRAVLCNAQLSFTNGLMAEINYGKGEVFWKSNHTFELHGEEGTLIFDGEQGSLIRDQEITEIPVASRRGLFVKDTQIVLDHLFDGKPLYVNLQASLYALKVANAACESYITGKTVEL